MASVMDMVLDRLNQIDAKVDQLMKNGCSKASRHESIESGQSELFKRVRSLEDSRSEGKGKLAVAVAVGSALLTLFFMWLGKKF
jgi:hypothetical protein